MIPFLAVIFFLQIVSCQEQMTCFRTNDTFQLPSSLPPSSFPSIRGNPGKQGPPGSDGEDGSKGEKGDAGVMGMKGDKGDLDTTAIDRLNDFTAEVVANLTALQAKLDKQELIIRLVADGWKFGGVEDGYLYKLTPNSQTWESSRDVCRSHGGDLAYKGIRLIEERRKVIRTLSITTVVTLLGARDIEHDGSFTWLDGEDVARNNWRQRQPDSPGRENCVNFYRDGNLNDVRCSYVAAGLCEISLSD